MAVVFCISTALTVRGIVILASSAPGGGEPMPPFHSFRIGIVSHPDADFEKHSGQWKVISNAQLQTLISERKNNLVFPGAFDQKVSYYNDQFFEDSFLVLWIGGGSDARYEIMEIKDTGEWISINISDTQTGDRELGLGYYILVTELSNEHLDKGVQYWWYGLVI